MKVKKFIGQVVNGFKILDTYGKITENGFKTRKVLLECQNCGAIFERNAGVDFEHIKCKCKCEYLQPNTNARKKYVYKGSEYYLFELENISDLNRNQIKYRLEKGLTVEQALQKKFIKICEICNNKFETENCFETTCCKTCKIRKSHGRGKYTLSNFICEVCGNEFQSYYSKSRFCCEKCRKAAARLERKKKFQNLKKQGDFDVSVTLEAVYQKFNGKCNNCNRQLLFNGNPRSIDYPTIDHIQPLSKGGSHKWDNVQLLCRHCNCTKGAKYDG